MKIYGEGGETYLYLNGIGVGRPLQLGPDVQLLPASCSPDPDDMIGIAETEVDLGVMTIFLRQVRSQLHITAESPKELATSAWNSLWDGMLLSAIHDCEAVCNFQSSKPAEAFSPESQLRVTNYHLRGLTNEPHEISEAEALWLEENFKMARLLLDKPPFQNAVHCMATYRWHSHPRARLALLWSGVEGLFKIQSELVFRISLYAARFLAPDDQAARKEIFEEVKKLYKQRSAAVHGSSIKGDPSEAVNLTARLLKKLLLKCIDAGELPRAESLAP